MRRTRRDIPDRRGYQRRPRSRTGSNKADPEKGPQGPCPGRASSLLCALRSFRSRRHRPSAGRSPDSALPAPQDQALPTRSGRRRLPTCPDRSDGSGHCRKGSGRPRQSPASCTSDNGGQSACSRLFLCSQLIPALRNHSRDHIVVVNLGDLTAIEPSHVQLFESAEVVDEDLTVDLGRMKL